LTSLEGQLDQVKKQVLWQRILRGNATVDGSQVVTQETGVFFLQDRPACSMFYGTTGPGDAYPFSDKAKDVSITVAYARDNDPSGDG
jgi:hypothetical protein